MAPNSSPKLEDFLGDATVETHQYGSHGTGAMVLSLDSMFYNQVPFKAQIGEDIQVQQQHHQYYSAAGIQYHDIYQTTDEQPDKETQLLGCKNPVPPMSEDAMTCLKTWVDHHALEQQVNPKMVGGGAMESLSLSMSPGSQSSCVTASRQISPTETEGLDMENRKRGHEKLKLKPKVHRKAIDSFGQRTSQYRGVTRSVNIYELTNLFFIYFNVNSPCYYKIMACFLADLDYLFFPFLVSYFSCSLPFSLFSPCLFFLTKSRGVSVGCRTFDERNIQTCT